MKRKKILFITTANLSTNPRLLKEVLFLQKQNISAEVLAFELGNWYDKNDRSIVGEYGLNVRYLPAHRKSFFPWLRSTFIHKLAKKVWNGHTGLPTTAYASNKRTYLLQKALQHYSSAYDFVIAHNLGALFPAYQFAKMYSIPFAFDVEDYHPGEIIEDDDFNEKSRRLKLMVSILPQCKYVSFASPLIEMAMKKKVNLVEKSCIHISNSFFADEFVPPKAKGDKALSFVWFSQYISYGRGLELFLKAADRFSNRIRVYIIGAENKEFYDRELQHRNYVEVQGPLKQTELHKYLSDFDVGLAIEIGNVDLNKELCISNKIFAYAQAGLYVMASDTQGQSLFLNSNPQFGILAEQTVQGFAKAIEQILKNVDPIRQKAIERYTNSKSLSYEREAQKVLSAINSTAR